MPYQSNMTAELKFDDAQFPSIIVNDGSVKSLDQALAWLSENVQALKRELACTGAILFRGFPITDAESYDALFSQFSYRNFTYQESFSNAVRINHTKNVFTANEAPKEVEIYLHNEMAQTPIYPDIISLFCEVAAESGGATEICRSDIVYEQLLAALPHVIKKLESTGVKYTTRMPAENMPQSGQGRSWKDTLSVENATQAEQKLSDLSYTWQWNDDNSLTVQTPALAAIKTLDDGRKVFFNQLIAAYCGWKGVKENPSTALCFGDDTAFDKEFLDTMVATASRCSYDLEWQNGDVAVVRNSLAMHGRRPYSGNVKRKVLVVLGLE